MDTGGKSKAIRSVFKNKEGVTQQVDTPQKIYNQPANLFVAGFIGSPSMNFIPGRVQKKVTRCNSSPMEDRVSPLLPSRQTSFGPSTRASRWCLESGWRISAIQGLPEQSIRTDGGNHHRVRGTWPLHHPVRDERGRRVFRPGTAPPHHPGKQPESSLLLWRSHWLCSKLKRKGLNIDGYFYNTKSRRPPYP